MHTPAVPSRYTSYAALNPPYDSSSLPLTILTLAYASDASLNPPYAFSHLPLPSTLLTPSPTCLILSTAYHPYTCVVPSQHAPNAAPTNPYASAPPPLTILTLLWRPQDMPPTPSPTCLILSSNYHPYALGVLLTCLRHCSHTSLILNATYHPYAPATLSRLDYNSSPHLCPHHSLFFRTHASSSLLLPRRPQDIPLTLPSTPLRLILSPPLTILMLRTSAPESGSEISDMVSSHELGIEVESQSHENNQDPPVLPESQPPSSQKPNSKRYQKEKTVEPCSPTEDAGQDDVIFSRKVKILSKERFVSNIAQKIPRLEKIQNDSKIPDYVCQKIAEAMSLLKMDLNYKQRIRKKTKYTRHKKSNKKCHTFEAAKDSRDQGDEMINVDVDHIDNEPPHTESPPKLNEAIHDETPLASPQNIQAIQEMETIKHDTMGQDMTDIMPEPELEVSSSTNFQGIFLSCIEEFGDILNYHSNITQESWKRGIDNINSIYHNQWDNLPKNDSHTFRPVGIKVISNQELKISAWLEELEISGLDFFKPTETEAFCNNNIWNLKSMKESAKPSDNIPKSENSFFKMIQSFLYPTNPIKHFWENVMFESIILVSYDVIAPK
ncbi:hypothetical protein O181_019781 [Austropuccinia psidii MF-1]|uniref:Uncharacterized protein n=1 Tax=Austropuccinia psidii MF-1 TaxID=1389203 RepID=A0A9Q3CC91_9BASI|nr:hypothetical protein [Austropuccinia psidii MF-1]